MSSPPAQMTADDRLPPDWPGEGPDDEIVCWEEDINGHRSHQLTRADVRELRGLFAKDKA